MPGIDSLEQAVGWRIPGPGWYSPNSGRRGPCSEDESARSNREIRADNLGFPHRYCVEQFPAALFDSKPENGAPLRAEGVEHSPGGGNEEQVWSTPSDGARSISLEP